MIRTIDGGRPSFILETDNTSYIFTIASTGHAEHLYYGAKIPAETTGEIEAIRPKREFEPGNVIVYSLGHKTAVPEDTCYEISAPGHGDIREPFIEAVLPDGSRSLDFIFDAFEIDSTAPASGGLPRSYSESGETEHLKITLKDRFLTLELHYCVYPECDAITRSAVLINNGEQTVELERLMSLQLDIDKNGFSVTGFHGAWAREMNKCTVNLPAGKLVTESRAGCSSSRANPFFMVHDTGASEDFGACYGFNLVYSGNHYSSVEVSAFGKTRIVSGIQPQGFHWLLGAGERFEAPEAVMTYSQYGFTGQSINMHRFVRDHIVRGSWKKKPRPVLLNTWEACYFNISESTLLSLAKTGRELGIELLVMDDGWFGERDNDAQSLGDWDVNLKKLPGGLKRLGDKLKAMDMQFGIWVEPEMVSVNSRLYKAHPDWAMAVPGALHSEGRNQRVLDLCNPQVVDYLIEKMTEVFSSADISYVKWDMNRIFSDVYSPFLSPGQQGETAHRYMLGLYRLADELTKRFPDILFEGCASGGNRFDLGMLSYFPQIWGSDNTDALCRAVIQEGYSYGYPLSCVSAHVAASPNHQTLRETPLETRFNVAAFAELGYECDLRDLNADEKKAVETQIAFYKYWREALHYGDFYRVKSGSLHEWVFVSPDRKRAIGMQLQELVTPNTQHGRFVAKGLIPRQQYRFFSIPKRVNIKQFGSLINTLAPFHVKQNSLIHNVIAKTVKMDGEAENAVVSGETLMRSGVALSQSFSGTGFNERVRVFSDFSSRLYFMEEIGKYSDNTP